MANPAHTTASSAPEGQPIRTPVTSTTKRGLATASFSLGFWGLMVFWWYPFGMLIAAIGLVLGLITIAMGIRAGKDGEHLGLMGVIFASIAIGMAIGVYRFVQMAFEGSVTGGLVQ